MCFVAHTSDFSYVYSNKGCESFDKSVQELYHHNLITDSIYCEGFIYYEVIFRV